MSRKKMPSRNFVLSELLRISAELCDLANKIQIELFGHFHTIDSKSSDDFLGSRVGGEMTQEELGRSILKEIKLRGNRIQKVRLKEIQRDFQMLLNSIPEDIPPKNAKEWGRMSTD